MEQMSPFLARFMENFKDVFDVVTLGVFVFSGVVMLVFDARQMEQKGLDREARVPKFFGWFYIISGLALFTAAKVF